MMLNSSVLLKVLYPQPLILPCLYFFLNSPFIISDVKQHILTWHSSWKVKMHATIIFNQKTVLDMEWVHTFHLTWKMHYKMILSEVPWNGLGNSHWRSKSLKGILRSFHQKSKNIFSWLQFISLLYISIPTSWKRGEKRSNIENVGGSHFMPL